MEVLGWDIDTTTLTISLPEAKTLHLQNMLLDWPTSRKPALESNVRAVTGTLLHVCEIVRPGK